MGPVRKRFETRLAGRILMAAIPAAFLAGCDYPYPGYAGAYGYAPPPLPYPTGTVNAPPPPGAVATYGGGYPPPGYYQPSQVAPTSGGYPMGAPYPYSSNGPPVAYGPQGGPSYPVPPDTQRQPGAGQYDGGGEPEPIAPPYSGPPVTN